MADLNATADNEKPDEWTPRERGLVMGHDIAEELGRGTTAGQLEPLAADPPQIPPLLRDRIMDEWGMRERLDASEDPDADSAFWGGFVSGVRAYIMKVRTGGTEN
jgi:hypothetical protein